jgi:hypothetical protein
VSVSGLSVVWDDLKEVINKLLSSSPNSFLRCLSQRHVASSAMEAVPSDQKSKRLTPRDGMNRHPMLALGALMLDPKITWL